MTYKLYNRRGSGGFVVEVALALAGQPYELVEIDTQPGTPLPEEFREINPWRQVPALILPDGTLMTETAAMLVHIAASHPEANIAPPPGTSEHARMLRWLMFLATNAYENVLRIVYPERYTSDSNTAEAVRQGAIDRNSAVYRMLEQQVGNGPFLLGDDMCVADVYLAMLFSWHKAETELDRLTALTHRVAAHPTIAPLWQHNFDHRRTIKWGRE